MKTRNKYPCGVLMVKPTHFDVKYAINVHMQDEQGNLNKVDTDLAMKQWVKLKETYESLGLNVHTLEDTEDLPDMVFCANTFLSFYDNDVHSAFLSNMHSKYRKSEVEIAKNWLLSKDVKVYSLPSELNFESMGDAVWNYETETLFAGYGFRTQKEVYNLINKKIKNVKILELVDERFYHLDTCLSIINGESACYVEEAFSNESIQVLKESFKNLIKIDLNEAIENFAANCHCPDGKNIIIHNGAKKLVEEFTKLGFKTIELDTSEFMKSGGSVFCMKNMIDL